MENSREIIVPTFGVRNDDRHQPGAPVGDLDAEIPHPELVHADLRRRPRVLVGAGGQHGSRDDAQHRKEQLAANASHGWPIDARYQAEAEPLSLPRRAIAAMENICGDRQIYVE